MTPPSTSSDHGLRTSLLDRSWQGYWTAIAYRPIQPPSVAELRRRMVTFMADHPGHPLACVLSGDAKRWQRVPAHLREDHAARAIVSGAAIDDNPDDPHALLMQQRPLDPGVPYRVVVGRNSMVHYFSHVAGDGLVSSPFSVLMTLGDVEGLTPLVANAGLPTAMRIVASQTRGHWREWLRYLRSDTGGEGTPPEQASTPAGNDSAVGIAPGQDPSARTECVGFLLSAEQFAAFKAWRKSSHPTTSATALMASATYLALAAEGVPVEDDGFFTLIDLRRHLPERQRMRPGNLAKSMLVRADLADPGMVSEAMQALTQSARAAPSLMSGALTSALRPVEIANRPTGRVRMTFNSMSNNLGIEHIPWTDSAQARYVGTTFPAFADGVNILASGIEGRLEFAASFSLDSLDPQTVLRALRRLSDMPGLLTAAYAAQRLADI